MAYIDSLQRFIFEKASIRGELIHLRESFQTIIHQHDYPPAIRQLLGEALCAVTLLSAMIKFEGRLTIQFQGKGKLKFLLAQCDTQFHLRGVAKGEENISHSELMDAFGQGVLAIMLDSFANTTKYQGIVAWQGHSLAESIEGYFQNSEQLSTKIYLNVSETEATGLLLQMLPTNQIKEDKMMEPNWQRIIQLTSHLLPEDMHYLNYHDLLRILYPEEEIKIFPAVPVSFQCTCSRKRGENALQLLGKKEAEAELKTNKTIVVTCEFCNKEYIFDAIDIATIFAEPIPPLH